MPKNKGGRPTGEHEWIKRPQDQWEFCKICSLIKRADGKNKPCNGPVKITLRSS